MKPFLLFSWILFFPSCGMNKTEIGDPEYDAFRKTLSFEKAFQDADRNYVSLNLFSRVRAMHYYSRYYLLEPMDGDRVNVYRIMDGEYDEQFYVFDKDFNDLLSGFIEGVQSDSTIEFSPMLSLGSEELTIYNHNNGKSWHYNLLENDNSDLYYLTVGKVRNYIFDLEMVYPVGCCTEPRVVSRLKYPESIENITSYE